MIDVGGQDASEAFEDVGHSDEAREILNGLLIGNLKREVRTTTQPPHTPLLPTDPCPRYLDRPATPPPPPLRPTPPPENPNPLPRPPASVSASTPSSSSAPRWRSSRTSTSAAVTARRALSWISWPSGRGGGGGGWWLRSRGWCTRRRYCR